MSSSQNSSSSSDVVTPFDWMLDVPCQLDVVLGTATLTVAECSRLAVHSVVRLRQAAGTDLDVRLGGVPFACGEVAIVDDNVSLRLARILPPTAEEMG